MEILLELQHVCASYDGKPVLRDICLTVPRGKILGLVGESGSGKSTTARVITGLLPTDSGGLLYEGQPLAGKRTREQHRKIQMVFQNPEGSLNPRHTVGRTLTDAIRFHGNAIRPGADGGQDGRGRDNRGSGSAPGQPVSAAEAADAAAGWLRRMELPEDSLSRYPDAFSGGQKQRIALARALAVGPELLIADEPTSSLDVSVQRTMLQTLKELKEEEQLTILFISHDLGVICDICDEIAVMQQGRIVEAGRTEDFFRQPRTAYGRQLLDSVPEVNLN